MWDGDKMVVWGAVMLSLAHLHSLMGLYNPFSPLLAHGLTVWYPEWQQPKSFVALTIIGIFHSQVPNHVMTLRASSVIERRLKSKTAELMHARVMRFLIPRPWRRGRHTCARHTFLTSSPLRPQAPAGRIYKPAVATS